MLPSIADQLGGILTRSLTVLGLTYTITQGETSLGIIGATVVSLFVFIYIETTIAPPMFDFSVFRNRDFSGALLGSIGMNFSFWPLMIFLPLHFQSVLGYSPVDAGIFLLAYTLPILIVPPFAERLALRYPPGIVIPAGLFTIGTGLLLMWHGASDATSLLPGCLIAGVGLGLTNTPVSNTTTGSVPANRAGMASGIDMSARLITLAINIAVMGWLLEQSERSYLQTHMAAVGTAANALAHGLSMLMLYGGVGVWMLAAASHFLFNSRRGNSECNSPGVL